MIREQLKRNDRDDGLQEGLNRWDDDDVVGQVLYLRIAFSDDGNDRTAASFNLLEVRQDFLIDESLLHDEDAGRVLIDQRDWAVLHFGTRLSSAHRIKSLLFCSEAVSIPTSVVWSVFAFEGGRR